MFTFAIAALGINLGMKRLQLKHSAAVVLSFGKCPRPFSTGHYTRAEAPALE